MTNVLISALAVALLGHGSSTRCGTEPSVETAPLHALDGTSTVLTMSSGDDHGKQTHLCQADYSLRITTPDGKVKTDQMYSSDGSWERPIHLSLEGYSADGRLLMMRIAEGGREPSDVVVEYATTSGHADVVDVTRAFAHRLSKGCREGLRVSGTTPDGLILQSSSAYGCKRQQTWSLAVKDNATGQVIPAKPHRIPRHVPFDWLEPATP